LSDSGLCSRYNPVNGQKNSYVHKNRKKGTTRGVDTT
jgi:hypothetical protein